MACSKNENSYCTGPECEIFDPINPDCKEDSCSEFIPDEKDKDINKGVFNFMKLSEGTKSWLFGFHCIIHSIYVYIAWYKLYTKLPSFMETFCIFIHDIGYCGMNYLSNKNHDKHEILGAKIAQRLFGEDAYNLCIGHRVYGEKLEKADEYSHVIMPIWVMKLVRVIENGKKHNLMNEYQWKKDVTKRWSKRDKGIDEKRNFKECFIK